MPLPPEALEEALKNSNDPCMRQLGKQMESANTIMLLILLAFWIGFIALFVVIAAVTH